MISMIRFEHGEKTCSTEAGARCTWNRLRGFGYTEGCTLFDLSLRKDEDDQAERCSECINRFGTGDIDEDLRQECQAEC